MSEPEGVEADGTDIDRLGDDYAELIAAVAAEDEALAADIETAFRSNAESVAELESALESREAEIEDLTSRLKRERANFKNYKKRVKEREADLKARATEDLVERLLEVRENLKRALEDEDVDGDDLREGVRMTLAEFDRVLDAEGVEEIAPEPGDEVDPNRHEVLMTEPSEHPEDTVASRYRSGYRMGDRVLRTAQVTVSDGDPVEE